MEPSRWVGLEQLRAASRQRLRDLIAGERQRARLHLEVARRMEPSASRDRLAHVVLGRWITVASVEGGLTGALGFAGVPLNFVLFAYCQVAVIVAVAEAYEVELEGDAGESAVLEVLGRVNGLEDLARQGPRVLGGLARALALRHGLGTLGRLVPMLAAPVGARLNRVELTRTGHEAMRRFDNVVMLG